MPDQHTVVSLADGIVRTTHLYVENVSEARTMARDMLLDYETILGVLPYWQEFIDDQPASFQGDNDSPRQYTVLGLRDGQPFLSHLIAVNLAEVREIIGRDWPRCDQPLGVFAYWQEWVA